MKKFAPVLVLYLALCSCAALSKQFTPTDDSGKTPLEKQVAPVVDETAPFLGPWGLVLTSLFGTGGAVFTIGKTIARIWPPKQHGAAPAMPPKTA